MGKYRIIFRNFTALLGCLLLFTACGKKDDPVQPSPSGGEGMSFISVKGKEGLNLDVESSAFCDVASKLNGSYDDGTSDDGRFLGMQFYQGEPVQLWASAPYKAGSESYVTVYMYRQDGTREVCFEQIDRLTGQRIGFRDSQGYYYSVNPGDNNSITKLDGEGKVLYTTKIEGDRGQVNGICELADGRLAVLVGVNRIAPVDCDIVLLDTEGKSTIVVLQEHAPGQFCYIGTSGEDLLLMREEQLYRVGLSDGKLERLFSFIQTAYSVAEFQKQVAFYLHEDGKLEVLRSDEQGGAVCETLCLTEGAGNRQQVFVRGPYVKNSAWLKEQVLKFNSSNDRYSVMLEGLEEWDNREDYMARTSVELAAGKGPDILIANMVESPGGLIEKGMLEDLAPLMAQAGIKEEDYFPMTFDTWRTGESIYSIRCLGGSTERLMSSAVLGDAEYPDIEALVDALLEYPEPAVYYNKYSAGAILRELLEGSEALWGMVEWEKGTCDFGGELFRKLLEAAKRYRYDERNNYPVICSYRDFFSRNNLYRSPSREELRAEGNVPVGKLFDDGSHPIIIGLNDTFSINANSTAREGAWEFLKFLLSEEVQGSVEDFPGMPVKISAFRAVTEDEILHGPSGNNWGISDPLSREKAEEVEALMNNVRALPYKTEDILAIVLEEAQEYFDGVKEIPQVVDAIENRVQLYLDERK